MRLLFCALVAVAVAGSSARADTFDITTYTPPAGWGAKPGKGLIELTTVDGVAKTFCRITLYASTRATGDARADFETDWRALVQPTFKGVGKPTMGDAQEEDGWKVLSGGTQVPFDGKAATVIQIVASRAGRRVPILYSATGDCTAQLEAFGKSVTFAKAATPATTPAVPAATPATPATTPAAPANTTTAAWVGVAKADWVEVTSSAGKVLIHYPNPVTSKYNSVLADSVRTAWTTLVAPHYSSITNLEIKPIQSYQSIAFAEADAVEQATNRKVHVVLFKRYDDHAQNRFLEFVTDSKAAFERAFGPYHKDEFHWESLTQLGNYDRFDVTKEGLAGTWTSSDSTSISYYYVSSGRAAGADATAIAKDFTFDGKGGYASDSASASGPVGSAKFSRQQYRGAYTIEGGIHLTLTNRFKGQPETYTAYFQAVKGGNALVMIDARSSVTYLGKKK